MTLDKFDKVSGYRRARKITVDNPLDGTPSIAFELEWAIDRDGHKVFIPGDTITVPLSDPSRPLNIMNPIDDTLIMPANDGFVQAVLYSIYMRDIAGLGHQ